MSTKVQKSDSQYIVGRRPPTCLSAKAQRQLKYSNYSRQAANFVAVTSKLFPTPLSCDRDVVVALKSPLKPRNSVNALSAKDAARFKRKTSSRNAGRRDSKGLK
jgi:hypothetical protein